MEATEANEHVRGIRVVRFVDCNVPYGISDRVAQVASLFLVAIFHVVCTCFDFSVDSFEEVGGDWFDLDLIHSLEPTVMQEGMGEDGDLAVGGLFEGV